MPNPLVEALQNEVLRIYPDARQLDDFRGLALWHEVTVTPAHTYDQILALPLSGLALSLRCRSGFALDIAQALLAHFLARRPAALEPDQLTVMPGLRLPNSSFDAVTYVPPAVASLFQHQSAQLNAVTAWLVPTHTCEFRSGQGPTAFWFGVRHGDITVIDWTRGPTPLIRARLLSRWPGGMLRYTKKPFHLRYASLSYLLPALPSSVSGLQLLSTWDTEVIVRRADQSNFQVTAAATAAPRTDTLVPESGIVPFVQSLLSTDTLPHASGAS